MKSLAIVALLVLGAGCGRKNQAECDATVGALGVGYQTLDSPSTEAERTAYRTKINAALDTWRAKRPTITLPELQKNGDQMADALTKHLPLLEQLKAKADGTITPPTGPQGSAFSATGTQFQEGMGNTAGWCAKHQYF